MRTPLCALVLAGLLAPGCGCQPEQPPPQGSVVGRIEARSVEGGFELVLSRLERPLSAVQVDVELEGARATRIDPAGPVAHDVLEADLAGPRTTFTAVVSDTRRLLLAEGAIAKITLDADAAPRLSRALAVDEQGTRRSLTVVVP